MDICIPREYPWNMYETLFFGIIHITNGRKDPESVLHVPQIVVIANMIFFFFLFFYTKHICFFPFSVPSYWYKISTQFRISILFIFPLKVCWGSPFFPGHDRIRRHAWISPFRPPGKTTTIFEMFTPPIVY